MEDVMFVVKCLIVTMVVVVCLQIRIGAHTVEGHVMSWVHRSPISQTLQDVAEGAVKVAQKSQAAVSNLIGSHESVDESAATEASTGSWFKIKRSAAYYRQKDREKDHDRNQESQRKPAQKRAVNEEERDTSEGERAPSDESL
jgi:hypothetical protein